MLLHHPGTRNLFYGGTIEPSQGEPKMKRSRNLFGGRPPADTGRPSSPFGAPRRRRSSSNIASTPRMSSRPSSRP